MATQDDKGAALQSLNSATLGAQFPEVTLPDGSKVQTGTVGALLVNIRSYNAAYAAGETTKLAVLEDSFRASLPLLEKVGMFGLFTPEEWMAGTNEGRKAVGRLYLELKSAQGS
ncbi:hypothetical protein F5Y15DRAFT_304717 [Xylariaceae sp. FL0016]|nr:hypothetical protein F5Y15DRAFT_304717 [Xylariaceae sp. FL0016]